MSTASNMNYFKYPASKAVITYLLIPLIAVISLGLGIFLLKSASTFWAVLFILFGTWFIFLSAFGSLMCSSITVSDDGIAANNFGRMLKFIDWREVTKVKKVRRWNAGSRSFEEVYYIFDGNTSPLRERFVNLRSPIAFNGKIRGARNLLDKINEAAQHYHFSLVVLDQEIARERAAKAGAGAWNRTVPNVEEVPLMKL